MVRLSYLDISYVAVLKTNIILVMHNVDVHVRTGSEILARSSSVEAKLPSHPKHI